jgi:hypothetical protein
MTDLRDAHIQAAHALDGLLRTAVEQRWDPARCTREADSYWRQQRTRGWRYDPPDTPPSDWRQPGQGTDRVGERAAEARALLRSNRTDGVA